MIKQELLASIIEIVYEENYAELNHEVKNAKEPKDAIFFIKRYEDLLNRKKWKIINIVGSRESCLKSLSRAMNSLVVFDSANLIFILRYVYISFCVNFLDWKNQLLPWAILRVTFSWSKKANV